MEAAMKTFKQLLIMMLVGFLLICTLAKAQTQKDFTEKQIANLVTGIKSGNNGLMRSSVYFAGKYKITETTDVLLEVLDSETNPSNIILIALAIYEIGDVEAMMKVIDTANKTSNGKVKRMLSAIAFQYLADNGMHYVLR
jgi:hypothetical protein